MAEDMKILRDQFKSIAVPQELDFAIEKAIRRGKRAKRGRMLPLAAAVFVLAFLLSINLSPAFASFVSDVPGMETLVNFLRCDKGLRRGIDEGADQVVDQTVTSQGISLTIQGVIYDGKKLLVGSQLSSTTKLGQLSPQDWFTQEEVPCSFFITPTFRDVNENQYQENLIWEADCLSSKALTPEPGA